MATTPLGPAALAGLLGDQARIRVRNTTADDDRIVVVAVVLARHDGSGGVGTDVEFGLDLAAGEEALFDPRPPSAAGPAAVEVLLRVRVDAGSPASADGQATLLDLYLKADAAGPGVPARGFDCGVRRHDGEIDADEQLLPGLPDIAAFARALR